MRWGSLRSAVELLTRLPVPATADFQVADLVDGAAWYPAVGLVIGGLLAAMAAALAATGLAAGVQAVLLVLASVWLTGALHEDGLADAADGLFGGWTAERRLEIMRDSRLGTYGGVALFGALALRCAALLALPVPAWPIALVIVHGLSRWGGLVLLATHRYARSSDTDSVAAKVVNGVGIAHLVQGSLWLVPLALLPGPSSAVLVSMLPVGWAWSWLARRRVGGMTGDLVGGGILLLELTGLVILGLVQAV